MKIFHRKKHRHTLQNIGYVYCKCFDTFKNMICNCFFFRQDICYVLTEALNIFNSISNTKKGIICVNTILK